MRTKLLILLIAFFAMTPFLMQAQKLTDEDMAKANNPLANMVGVNIQNYYVTKFANAPADAYTNTTWIRYIQPFAKGRLLLRASIPLSTQSMIKDSLGTPKATSGIGDVNAFLSFNFISKPTMTVGVGPLVQAPTGDPNRLGSDQWSAGLALVAFFATNPKLQYGALVTWQRSFTGHTDQRQTSELFIFQPFTMFQLGGGTYLRTAPQWVFNLQTGDYSAPMGLGIGHVLKVGGTVFNLFIEPQYTMISSGTQPQFQIFSSLMMQFSTGKKASAPPK